MDQFPRMMYRAGGAEEIHGHKLATLTVNDEAEQKAALADGWHLTTTEAVDADKEASKAASTGQTGPADNAPPTRDELKTKAAELGIDYPGNISTAKLAELVEQALKPKE